MYGNPLSDDFCHIVASAFQVYIGLLLQGQCFEDRIVLSRLPILWRNPKSALKSPHIYYIHRSGFNHCKEADKILSIAVFLSLCSLVAQDRWNVGGTCMAQSCSAKIVAEPA